MSVQTFGQLRACAYGTGDHAVIVVHGGPAAPGSARGLALGLAGSFRVIEPWQRGSEDEPLTVARHVEDLHSVVEAVSESGEPSLVGHSWGAMLALAYAAEHPDSVGPVALVGCGTFDLESRARYVEIRKERETDELRGQLAQLREEITDPGELLTRRYELSHCIDHYDTIPDTGDPFDEPYPPFDSVAHGQTWQDMIRLQAEGVYPAALSAIRRPVMMLHGAYDPHPGRMIHASLQPHIPHLEYTEWERCGHTPWEERYAREGFFECLVDWLEEKGRGNRETQKVRKGERESRL